MASKTYPEWMARLVRPTGKALPTVDHKIRRPHLLAAAAIAHLITLPVLLEHHSEPAILLGRYSGRYAAILAAFVVITLFWLLVWVFPRRAAGVIDRIPLSWRVAVIALVGLALMALWFTRVEEGLKAAFSLSWLFGSLVLLSETPDRAAGSGRWMGLLIAGVLMLLVPMFIGTLTPRGYSPDEAHYLDQGTAAFLGNPPGVYDRLWLETPYRIYPGHGWMIAAYGWLQLQLSPDIVVGRIWNFVGYLLAFAGISLATRLLYGWRAAALSTAFAALSMAFIPIYDFRPNHQLAAAGAWIVVVALVAGRARAYATAGGLHFLCGLLATLSLQVHMAGLVFALGMSLFYLGRDLSAAIRRRQRMFPHRLFWFSLGAGLGMLMFYYFNILPGGGLANYVANLLGERGGYFDRAFYPYDWPSLFERVVIWAGLAYVLVRRAPADRLFLGLAGSILVAALLVDTQGYLTTFNFLYVIPIGTLLIDGWRAPAIPRGKNRNFLWAVGFVFAVMAAQGWSTMVTADVWTWFRTGQLPPYLYQELRPVLEPRLHAGDRIVSTHQLLWTFPERQNLVSYAAEATAMRRWSLVENVEVWERLQPTVILHVPGQMSFGPGLKTYMEAHRFGLCEALDVVGYRVEIYRPVCTTLN